MPWTLRDRRFRMGEAGTKHYYTPDGMSALRQTLQKKSQVWTLVWTADCGNLKAFPVDKCGRFELRRDYRVDYSARFALGLFFLMKVDLGGQLDQQLHI